MASDPQPQFTNYRPSGKVNWARYLPALILVLCISVIMAFVLCWAFIHDWYYPFFLPAVAALIVGIAMRSAVAFGHCRSRLVATLAGALVGAIMYLGYYHIHFVAEVGRRGISRADLLPGFIKWRMRNDFSVDQNDRPLPPRPAWNWTRFGIDLALAMTIVAGLARSRASRPYCEFCRRWMRKYLFVAAPGTGQVLAEALTRGEIDKLGIIEPYPIRLHSTLIDVEYCPGRSGSESPCLTYITVSEFSNKPPPVEISPPDLFGVSR